LKTKPNRKAQNTQAIPIDKPLYLLANALQRMQGPVRCRKQAARNAQTIEGNAHEIAIMQDARWFLTAKRDTLE
jgi:hypothetical protein